MGHAGLTLVDTKRCPDCDAELPISEFGKNRSTNSGMTVYCKKHGYERKRKWQKANPETMTRMRRHNSIKALYGIGLSEAMDLLSHQGGLCAVCHLPIVVADSRGWNVDHCHKTGVVRGILHGPCNAMLGMAGDDPEMLRLGAEYLEQRG